MKQALNNIANDVSSIFGRAARALALAAATVAAPGCYTVVSRPAPQQQIPETTPCEVACLDFNDIYQQEGTFDDCREVLSQPRDPNYNPYDPALNFIDVFNFRSLDRRSPLDYQGTFDSHLVQTRFGGDQPLCVASFF